MSDDDDGDGKTRTLPITSTNETPTQISSETKLSSTRSTDWIVHRKDIMRVPDLTIKHSDLVKKAMEIRCSAICFGNIEFNVESEMILVKETELELKLKSEATNERRRITSLSSFR